MGCSPKKIASLKALWAANVGRHPSAETRAKMSAAQKGRKVSPETRAKMRAAKLGKKMSPEARAKMRAAKLGTHPSLETREKMSISHMGRKCSAETRSRLSAAQMGNQNALGRILSPESRAKIGASRKGKYGGSKCPAWRGGVSREHYAWSFNKELKEEVRRRDGYQCQLCGVSQAECKDKLNVHHVDYNKKNSDPVNLVALCRPCHARTNLNRKHWTVSFQEKALGRARQGLSC